MFRLHVLLHVDSNHDPDNGTDSGSKFSTDDFSTYHDTNFSTEVVTNLYANDSADVRTHRGTDSST